jgi:hypothetical protein
MFQPREFIIRLALEHFKGIYKRPLLENISNFLRNIFTISAFLFNTFRILNVDNRQQDEAYEAFKIRGDRR